MVRILTSLVLLAGLANSVHASDEIPGSQPKTPIAVTHAVIHPVTSGVIEDATLVFDKGKITAVGKEVAIPPNAVVIDAKGQHLYPGMIEAHSQIGLTEVASLRPSHDFRETGEFNPNVSAHVAVNPDSELIPVARLNGVLAALSAPSGPRIAGNGSLMVMDGWTYEDMTVSPSAVMVVNLPVSSPSDTKERKDATKKELEELEEFLEKSKRYPELRKSDANWPYDIRLEAMQDFVNGKQPMLVEADTMQEIESAVAFSNKHKLKMILLGGSDAAMCADLLKKFNVPVVLSSVHRLPAHRHDPYDAAYTLPARLKELGVTFCISGSAREETWNARNLPYHAGTAVGFGLSQEDAIASVTLWPAQILGVANRMGSLEVGKDATLFLSTGNPMETTSQVSKAYILGKPVDLQSKQTRLYQKYQSKYEQMQGK